MGVEAVGIQAFMNAQVSRMLRRYARQSGAPLRSCKRMWNLTPRPNRHIVRGRIESTYETEAQKEG